jgi:hypothetical protein
MVMSLSKNAALCIFQNTVSETGFCLRLQVKPTQLGPIDRASPSLRTLVPVQRWGTQARRFVLCLVCVPHLGVGTG